MSTSISGVEKKMFVLASAWACLLEGYSGFSIPVAATMEHHFLWEIETKL